MLVYDSSNALHQSPRPYADLQKQHLLYNLTSSLIFCAIRRVLHEIANRPATGDRYMYVETVVSDSLIRGGFRKPAAKSDAAPDGSVMFSASKQRNGASLTINRQPSPTSMAPNHHWRTVCPML